MIDRIVPYFRVQYPNIEFKVYPYKDKRFGYAFAEFKDGKQSIHIHSEDIKLFNPKEQSWIIWHELGHILEPITAYNHKDSETLADYFASQHTSYKTGIKTLQKIMLDQCVKGYRTDLTYARIEYLKNRTWAKRENADATSPKMPLKRSTMGKAKRNGARQGKDMRKNRTGLKTHLNGVLWK